MTVPFSYSFRNLWKRRLTTILTVSGMALVVFVFAAVLMMAAGLQKTLVETGSPDNVVVVRKASSSEVMSSMERKSAAIVEMLPQVAMGQDGQPLMAKECVVLIALRKKGEEQASSHSNVVVRGIQTQSLPLRPQVKLTAGRMLRMGSSEVVVGNSIAKGFQGVGLQQTLTWGMRTWTVVGIFDAGNTGFASEIWGDVDQVMQAFRRPVYSSLIFKLNHPDAFEAAKTAIETDPRFTLEARRETKYYRDQSEMMAKFLRILGLSLTIIFSIGAIIGAMITMYSAVSNRTAEIGTLRALGFRRRNILLAFLTESLLLGFIGGFLGLFFASFMQFMTISTVNFQTFSELAFKFTLTPGIILESMFFALAMGLIGGVLPALRASRMKIVDALRAS
ncbi:MAG: Macrolide export ATP-binding/permease protein MacB [Deltaproteobacteria bacterium ADurb.Bin151]|jgi:ABC-type lipoprotein release transport system permease subunit|nr:ABC transporter permease [Smithella sp.]OQB55358.1 MAG: Macrolide export ATP-binding/permease protein MacB [Deltaproteobacteria bacterium ADurb.Bin151]HNZ11147.1 ABC transporter permease [Smithellaceae bacterium]HOQ42018.1 ABC transporter permease [Smithellaceae bacterium]HPL65931.1 ABC transporter permease [Smithellaceae bacterium]